MAPDKVLPGDAVGIPSIQIPALFWREVAAFPAGEQPFDKSEMRPYNSPKRRSLTGKEGFPGKKIIKGEAKGDLPDRLAKRQVFGQHNQVIAKIQEGFPGIALWQRATAHVKDY